MSPGGPPFATEPDGYNRREVQDYIARLEELVEERVRALDALILAAVREVSGRRAASPGTDELAVRERAIEEQVLWETPREELDGPAAATEAAIADAEEATPDGRVEVAEPEGLLFEPSRHIEADEVEAVADADESVWDAVGAEVDAEAAEVDAEKAEVDAEEAEVDAVEESVRPPSPAVPDEPAESPSLTDELASLARQLDGESADDSDLAAAEAEEEPVHHSDQAEDTDPDLPLRGSWEPPSAD